MLLTYPRSIDFSRITLSAVGVCTMVIATIGKGNVFLLFRLLLHSGTFSSSAQTAKSLIELWRLLISSLQILTTLYFCEKLLRKKSEGLSIHPVQFFSILEKSPASDDLHWYAETRLKYSSSLMLYIKSGVDYGVHTVWFILPLSSFLFHCLLVQRQFIVRWYNTFVVYIELNTLTWFVHLPLMEPVIGEIKTIDPIIPFY